MKSEISKLFEMMQKLSPDFKLNEDSFGRFDSSFGNSTQAAGPQPAPNQPAPNQPAPNQPAPNQPAPKTGDAKNYNKAAQNAKTLATKSDKINNRVEFPEAFRIWFNSLGYSPEKGNITIAMVNAEIRKIMTQMGYK